MSEHLLSPKELAAYLNVPVSTIYQWRYQGRGPTGHRVGKHVRFRWEDVEAWLARHGDHEEVHHGGLR